MENKENYMLNDLKIAVKRVSFEYFFIRGAGTDRIEQKERICCYESFIINYEHALLSQDAHMFYLVNQTKKGME